MKIWRTTAAIAAVAMLATACGDDTTSTDDPAASADSGGTEAADSGDGEAVSGEVVAAGSSTVLPVAEIILEEYRNAQPDVDATYTSIGSGGGFERLCEQGDVDFSGASRAIKDEEAQACADNGIEFIELQFGVDALTMVTSPETDYLECLTTDQIVQVFGPDRASTWDEVVDGAPADELSIIAPDTDSGTYGFMVEDIMGLEESTQDYQASADDNVIVQGVQADAGTWGFLGLAYYSANSDGLKSIAHENSDGECVQPSVETAADGSYELVRPLFIYVNTASLKDNPAVADLVGYFLDTAPEAIDFVGYVQDEAKLDASKETLTDALG